MPKYSLDPPKKIQIKRVVRRERYSLGGRGGPVGITKEVSSVKRIG